MTDLSTNNLKYLLENSAPGPWHFTEDTADTLSGTQETGHEVYADKQYLFGTWGDDVIDDCPTTLPLAAASKDLAHEVIRLRTGLEQILDMCLLERDAAFNDTPMRAGELTAFNLCAEQLGNLLETHTPKNQEQPRSQ